MKFGLLSFVLCGLLFTMGCSQARYGHLTVRSADSRSKVPAKTHPKQQTEHQPQLEQKTVQLELAKKKGLDLTYIDPLDIAEETVEAPMEVKLPQAVVLPIPVLSKTVSKLVPSETDKKNSNASLVVIGVIFILMMAFILAYLGVAWWKIILFLLLGVILGVLMVVLVDYNSY